MKKHNILLFLCLTLLSIVMVCYFFPSRGVHIGASHLTMPTVTTILHPSRDTLEPEIAEIPEIQEEPEVSKMPEVAEVPDTSEIAETPKIQEIAETPKIQEKPVKPKVPEIPTDAPYQYLQRFYRSLSCADATAVRVVHYGDSQIEGDRMTINIRQALQSRFGGGGVGLIPVYTTLSSLSVSQSLYIDSTRQTQSSRLARYMAFGPKRYRRSNGQYGPLAQMVVMDNSQCRHSEDLTLLLSVRPTAEPFTRIRILYEQDSIIEMTAPTRYYTLPLQHKGDIYGVSLETEKGVIVDNIPMRGCAGTIFTSISPDRLKDYFSTTNTSLIILQYGGNVMPYTMGKKSVDSYCERLRKQIRYFRRIAPQADILFVGPSDMLTRKDGNLISYPILPTMDKHLRQMAHSEGVAYYSLYEAMGGRGGMQRWIQSGLAGKDGVHFTRKGANKAGDDLAQWLLNGITATTADTIPTDTNDIDSLIVDTNRVDTNRVDTNRVDTNGVDTNGVDTTHILF
ncbi:MAG: hypothetical protein IJS00_03415 [Paludibacteraceae bacterium]|nr:hypothetical protein [Paludibacteraceae bacterium]